MKLNSTIKPWVYWFIPALFYIIMYAMHDTKKRHGARALDPPQRGGGQEGAAAGPRSSLLRTVLDVRPVRRPEV